MAFAVAVAQRARRDKAEGLAVINLRVALVAKWASVVYEILSMIVDAVEAAVRGLCGAILRDLLLAR